jgi:hypothetical protein
MPTQCGALLSRGVSIKGSIKFLNALFIDGEVEGTIDSAGTLTIGEHARIRGKIRTKSVKVRGTVDGNIFITEGCELHAGCTLRGDIATFCGSAKVGDGEVAPGLTFASGLVFFSHSFDAVIRVYDEAGNGLEPHEHAGQFKEW